MEEKIILHDEQCERQILGVQMLYPNSYTESLDLIKAEAFYSPINRFVYGCIGAVISEGDVPDLLKVFEYTRKHPKDGICVQPGYLAECTSSVASSVTFRQNCERLADLHRRRQLYFIGHQLMSAGTSELGDTDVIKAKAVESLQGLDDTPQASVKSVRGALSDLNAIVEANRSGQRSIGIPTGFKFLDEKGGMQPTDLWVIAADSSQGKTSLALDICLSAARQGYPAAFYSIEMMSTQLAARMLAGQSGISSRIILQQPLDDGTMPKFQWSVRQIEGLPIYFDDSSTQSFERIVASIRTLHRKMGVKVAFVDYLQILTVNEKGFYRTTDEFYGMVARKFKNLAKELQVCIVLLNQISRSPDGNPEPSLSRIRGSGQINEAADVSLLLYRPESYGKKYSGEYAEVSTRGTALIKLAKGRSVGTGATICGFDASTNHFYELREIPKITDDERKQTVRDEDRPF